MADTLRLDIAGICVEYRLGSDTLAALVRQEMGPFLSPKPAELTLELAHLDGYLAHGWLPLSLRENGNELRVERHDMRCTIDLAGGSGSGVMSENTFAFGTLLRGLYSRLLLDRQGIILHASALIRRGRAHAFTGPSGSGKTTIALLSPENELITDELMILRRNREGVVEACGTPFIGESMVNGLNVRKPLRRLFFLVQAPENRAAPLSAGRALSTMMGQVMFFDRSPVMVNRMLDLLGDLLVTLDTFELHFLPEPGIWNLIDSLDDGEAGR
jgi:hypothetical protein